MQNYTIVLIDGERLAELMIKYKLGVQVRQNIEICDIDSDFFGDKFKRKGEIRFRIKRKRKNLAKQSKLWAKFYD